MLETRSILFLAVQVSPWFTAEIYNYNYNRGFSGMQQRRSTRNIQNRDAWIYLIDFESSAAIRPSNNLDGCKLLRIMLPSISSWAAILFWLFNSRRNWTLVVSPRRYACLPRISPSLVRRVYLHSVLARFSCAFQLEISALKFRSNLITSVAKGEN